VKRKAVKNKKGVEKEVKEVDQMSEADQGDEDLEDDGTEDDEEIPAFTNGEVHTHPTRRRGHTSYTNNVLSIFIPH
jgi:hypothetical protein